MISEYRPRRVVITGIGVISACGSNLSEFWKSIVNAQSGACEISLFDTSDLPTKFAAEISDFDCATYLSPKKFKRYDRGMQLAAAASLEAMADSKIRIKGMDADRVGLIHANSLEGMESAFRAVPIFEAHGYKKIGPTFLLNNYFGAASGELAMLHGIRGHAITYSSGSASGSDVITLAADMVRNDDVDAMLVGASEAPLLIQILAGFCNARVVSRRNEDMHGAMRPFDLNNDGFLLGEGAAFFVLEEESHALARGARIYAEVAGGARSCEAFHPVNVHPDGVGIKSCVARALKKARITASEVNYINAHGTATDQNDRIEAQAIASIFKAENNHLSVSATKPSTGHLLAASGAIETAICALSVYHQIIPPTRNLADPIDGGLIDFVRGSARSFPVEVAMNLNAGFGGKNACIILKRHSV